MIYIMAVNIVVVFVTCVYLFMVILAAQCARQVDIGDVICLIPFLLLKKVHLTISSLSLLCEWQTVISEMA